MKIRYTDYSPRNERYFGVSLLDLDSYGARLISKRVIQPEASHLFFDEASAYYHADERALTVEGTAKSPAFAVSALGNYAKVAREMDELAKLGDS